MSTITTKAFGTQHAKGHLEAITIERRAPLDNDVAIKILYCGVCHTDLHMVNEDWKRNEYPLVPGHEIVGEVISVGSKVSKFKAGDKVGVGFSVDSCRTCETCKKSLVQYCVDNIQTAAFVDKYHDGRQTYGGYSEMIVVRQEYVVTIPNGFADLAAVAPLLCAGITMYSPLAWYKVTQGTKVGIVGYGGLGHMGVKFARAMGAEVTVFSRSDQGTLTKLGTHIAHAIGAHVEMTTDKEAEAKQAGASRVIVSDDPAQMAEYADYFDLILDTIPYQHDLTPYIKCVGIGGVFCGVGYMGPTTKIDTSLLIFGRKTVAGSAIGSTKEMEEMMEFSLKHGVLANVEKINIREVNDVYKRMLKSEVDHRYVIDMSTI